MSRPIRPRGRPKKSKDQYLTSNIQALDRALDVLDALAVHEGMTLSELSTYLEQSPATMHRVLATLEKRRYVENNPERQEWFVGSEGFRLGAAFLRRTNVVERSRSVMRDLTAKTGETSNLGIERDSDVLFVSQVETHETIRAFFPPGTRSPLHASGIGKALLSAFDEQRLEVFIKNAQFTRYTNRTISNPSQLRDAVREIKEKGYSLDNEERTIGMRCVAAPILNSYNDVVAGLSISGPTIRMTEARIQEMGQLVKDAAGEVSRRLGAK